ncbi:MAG: helix-turn-helix transcriptional regulator [Bacteroidetes bacterium]|nr:helix-turn-helix transcriptional regulator [Bacteroidota bacterium]
MYNHTYHMILTDKDNQREIKIDFLQTKKVAIILRSLNHKLRQQIIKLLDHQEKMTVTEIYVQLRLEQSVTSQHLAILRKANLVRTHREGKFIYYSINYERLNSINQFVKNLVEISH